MGTKAGKEGKSHYYRSIRGRPNCLKTLLSANHVIAEMWSPARVSTKSANARATGSFGSRKGRSRLLASGTSSDKW